jgi:hypothetical protein
LEEFPSIILKALSQHRSIMVPVVVFVLAMGRSDSQPDSRPVILVSRLATKNAGHARKLEEFLFVYLDDDVISVTSGSDCVSWQWLFLVLVVALLIHRGGCGCNVQYHIFMRSVVRQLRIFGSVFCVDRRILIRVPVRRTTTLLGA